MIFGYEKEKDWPICILTAEGKPESEEEIKNLLNGWSTLYEKSESENTRFKFLIDVRLVKNIDIKYLIMIGKYLISVKDKTEKWMDKTAILVSSPTIKMFIKFVFTIYKPVRPFKVFNEPAQSIQWLLSQNETSDHL